MVLDFYEWEKYTTYVSPEYVTGAQDNTQSKDLISLKS